MNTAPPAYPGHPVPPDPDGPPVVPPPPPGPGVHPPFPAPPVEGRGRRVGLGLGITAGVGASLHGALNERARKPVADYLDALHDQHYDQAYAMLCRTTRRDETPAEFRRKVTAMKPIRTYELGDLDPVNLEVPVRATYQNGDTGDLAAYLEQNQTTGDFEVCELGE
jgi:hypothetical protein